jgi:uncharacterized protein (TIGR02271 family)
MLGAYAQNALAEPVQPSKHGQRAGRLPAIPGNKETSMTTTITAAFDDEPTAKRAGESLAEHGIGKDKVTLLHGAKASLPGMDAESAAYNEALRRGGALLLARVDDLQLGTAIESLEKNGAIDLERREQDWQASGWAGGSAAAATAATAATPGGTAAGRAEDAIRVVEERLVIGKRDVSRGTVRVRVHVQEVPVEIPVTLRQERVVVEHHPVNRPVTPADTAAFQSKTIEAVEMAEQPVVAKEVVVTEEIALRKEAVERVETVRDTVRRTEVDIEGDAGARPAGQVPDA